MGHTDSTYYYTTECVEFDIDQARKFTSYWDNSLDYHATWIAADAAENYHDFHDGWDSSWPQKFMLYDKDKMLLGVFEIDREAHPEFVATKVESPEPGETVRIRR